MDSCILLTLGLLIIVAILSSAAASKARGGDFIVSSCKVTRYPDVCVASLSAYAAFLQAEQSQHELVKAAVEVTLFNAQNMTAWGVTLSKRIKGLHKRERSALKDCVESFGDTSDQIKQSLAELKHLKPGTFEFQMSNVQTWMSAALTYEDSCLDGFQAVRSGRVKMVVKGRVQNACKMISNALALVNSFATRTGY